MGMRPVAEQFKTTQLFRDNLTQYNLGTAHGAIDFACPIGTPVVASADGVVTFADWAWNLPGDDSHLGYVSRYYQIKAPLGNVRVGGGILVTLDHGLEPTPYVTINAHLSKTHLNPGDRVRKGQIIGYSGNTGSSTGPHLHFALLWKPFAWSNGYYGGIDPAQFIREQFRIFDGQPVDERKTTSEGYMHGIDVSSYQPADIVRRVPSDFVIVKATEGVGWRSDRWEQQVHDARAAGKKVGVYHFARPLSNSSDAEALWFYNTVKHLDRPDLVWFLDWEEEGAYGYNVWARDFMARLDRMTGRQTGIYANNKGLSTGTWASVDLARPVWRAFPVMSGQPYATSFNLPPLAGGWEKLVMDQYSFHGRLPGYSGDLDLNVYYGGLLPWGAAGSTATQPQDLLEELMSTPEERAALVRDIAAATADQILNTRVPVQGVDPITGRAYNGHTTLRNEISWGTMRGFRDRRIEAGHAETQALIRSALESLSPKSTDKTEEV